MVFLCKGKLASRHKLPCVTDSRSLTVRAGGPSGASAAPCSLTYTPLLSLPSPGCWCSEQPRGRLGDRAILS